MSISVPQTLILASSSPRRQELIQTLGLPYEIRASDVNEDTEAGMPPAEIVEELSCRKAEAVCELYRAEQRNNGIVIGSDTIVVLGEEVLGKPRDQEDAARMLDALQGKSHHVFTGVACVDLNNSNRQLKFWEPSADRFGDTGQYRILSESPNSSPGAIVGHMVSKVTFRPMSRAEIQGYVQTGEPMDKAGAYGVQGFGAVFIEKIEGDFYTVMGLPLNLIYQILLRFGVSPFSKNE
jgi:septum formation protein